MHSKITGQPKSPMQAPYSRKHPVHRHASHSDSACWTHSATPPEPPSPVVPVVLTVALAVIPVKPVTTEPVPDTVTTLTAPPAPPNWFAQVPQASVSTSATHCSSQAT